MLPYKSVKSERWLVFFWFTQHSNHLLDTHLACACRLEFICKCTRCQAHPPAAASSSQSFTEANYRKLISKSSSQGVDLLICENSDNNGLLAQSRATMHLCQHHHMPPCTPKYVDIFFTHHTRQHALAISHASLFHTLMHLTCYHVPRTFIGPGLFDLILWPRPQLNPWLTNPGLVIGPLVGPVQWPKSAWFTTHCGLVSGHPQPLLMPAIFWPITTGHWSDQPAIVRPTTAWPQFIVGHWYGQLALGICLTQLSSSCCPPSSSVSSTAVLQRWSPTLSPAAVPGQPLATSSRQWHL